MEFADMVSQSITITKSNLTELQSFLQAHLVNDIIPFWTRHAVDDKNGGLFTCINDDGTLQSREKYIWSQARGLWTFSALYRRIEQREEWLDVAHGLFRFLQHCGRDTDNCWVFLTTESGRRIKGAESIVTDAFAIMGLVEYFRITENPNALKMAVETYESVIKRLAVPYSYGTAPYPTPRGLRPHREPMQFSLAFHELAAVSGNEHIRKTALEMGDDILNHFVDPKRQVIHEYISLDNRYVSTTPAGRAMVPGHGIESMYFQILNFSRAGKPVKANRACTAMKWCLEKGWDSEYGGILLGIDIEGKEPVYWKNHEKKLWWVHSESLAGLLLAYEQCNENWCLEWYQRVHDWSFAHYPVREHGEWTQRLDRSGRKITDLIALPVKDPFHLPRALIVAIESLNRMTTTP